MAKGEKMAEEKNVRFGSSPALDRPVPSFFKVIFDRTLQEKKMMIPLPFSRDYNGVFLDEANLIVPNGHAWKVGLSKSEDAIFFDQNWSDFVEHYSIHLKHILIFDFRGSSTFHVRIFNPSGCEMHYPSNATQKEPEDSNISSISLKGRARKFESVRGEYSKRPASAKKNQATAKQCEAENRKNVTLTSPSKERAIVACRKFKTERPSFTLILRKINFRYNFAYVPAQSAREILKEVPEYIKLQTVDGREWTLKINQKANKRLTLGSGWNLFLKENDLKEGDACVFELIEKNVFRVIIFQDRE